MTQNLTVSKTRPSEAGVALTRLILETFRLNGRLLAAGDRLGRDLGLTSARWQVLGAIDGGPAPVANIARDMGLTRQAVQRVADELAAEGFVAFSANPHHRRAKLVGLTAKGRSSLEEIGRRQTVWANQVAHELAPADIDAATKLAATLISRLAEIKSVNKEG